MMAREGWADGSRRKYIEPQEILLSQRRRVQSRDATQVVVRTVAAIGTVDRNRRYLLYSSIYATNKGRPRFPRLVRCYGQSHIFIRKLCC